MATVIERDSPAPALLLILIIALLLVGGGVGVAYINGAFDEKTVVVENDKTVENKIIIEPVSPFTPASTPESKRPDEIHPH
jgi:hypothetical protein